MIKMKDKVRRDKSFDPTKFNMFGVSDHQNDKVLKKIYGLQLKKDETYAWLYSDKSGKSN